MTDREHPYQQTIELCQAALESVRDELGEHYAQASEFVLRYDEWLVGLEFAIDCLVESESAVSRAAYDVFERAYSEMRKAQDDRLRNLQDLVTGAKS